MDQEKQSAAPRRQLALRLTFTYEGSEIRLVSQQSVEMTLPPSHDLQGYEGHSGFWYVLQDAQGQPLYRRTTQNPMKHDVEVFSNEPATSIARQNIDQPKGSFVLLVPAIAGTQTVALFSHPLKMEASARPVTEIARFDLTKK
jgi:hypothetical protein